MSVIRTTAALATCVVALLFAACGDDTAAGGPTATLSASAAASPTPPALPGYAAGTRTGVATIDPVLVDLFATDATALLSRMATVKAPCTTAQQMGGAVCPPGAADGTIADVFPVGHGCQGSYVRRDELPAILAGLDLQSARLFAVFTQTPSPGDPAQLAFPAGDTVIVLAVAQPGTPARTGARLVHLTGDRIVAIGSACTQTPADVLRPIARVNIVLAPP